MPTDAQNAYVADTFGVDPQTYAGDDAAGASPSAAPATGTDPQVGGSDGGTSGGGNSMAGNAAPGDPAVPGTGDAQAGQAAPAPSTDGTPAGPQDQGTAASDQPASAAAGDAATPAAAQDAGAASATSAASTNDAAVSTEAAAAKPALSVKSNGDGTFVLSGSGFVGNTAYIRAVGTGARDYAYGQAWGSVPVSGGSFSATTPDVCGVEGGDRFFSANDGRPDPSDKTGTLWSNTVQVACPSGGGGGKDPGDDPGDDPGTPGSDSPAGGASDPSGNAAPAAQAGALSDSAAATQDAADADASAAGASTAAPPAADPNTPKDDPAAGAPVSAAPTVTPDMSAASLLDLNSPTNRQATEDAVAQSDEAKQWIRNYLRTNDLRPDILGNGSGATVMFGNKTTQLSVVVNTTLAAGRMANLAHGGQALITAERVQSIISDMLLAATPHAPGGPTGPGGTGSGGPQRFSMYLQYMFTPTTVHTPNAGGPESSDQPAHTLTGQITAEFHADNGSGLEVSALGQATWFADDRGGRIVNQSGFTGVQVAWVWSFLGGALQAGPQFQALVGASRAQQRHSDRLQWVPTGQVGAGGQVQYAVPGLGGHVLVGFQAGVSGTAADGAPSTTDRTAGFTLTYKF